MKKLIVVLFLALGVSAVSYAGNGKNRAIKGKVVDIQGDPIAGAKVIIEGIDKPIYTDFDGEFAFPRVSNTTCEISVSMVSFEENSLIVNSKQPNPTSISITLEER